MCSIYRIFVIPLTAERQGLLLAHSSDVKTGSETLPLPMMDQLAWV